MIVKNINDFFKGWIVGNFEPSILKENYEVGLKYYKNGDFEQKHHHKIATEITVIASGKVKMFDRIFSTGDIIIVEPNDSTSFEVLEDTITLVVKTQSIQNDKYLE
jgi:quercetin dioxygenase-like cupin family protein